MSAFEKLNAVLLELANSAAQGCAYEKWPDEFCRKENKEVWTDAKGPMRRPREYRFTVEELKNIPRSQLEQLGFRPWDGNYYVIPLWAFNYIADGEKLICIDNSEAVKGTDEIDLDQRFGCIAFGFILT